MRNLTVQEFALVNGGNSESTQTLAEQLSNRLGYKLAGSLIDPLLPLLSAVPFIGGALTGIITKDHQLSDGSVMQFGYYVLGNFLDSTIFGWMK